MQEMTKLEKLQEELYEALSYDDWKALAKHVQRMVLEARLDELEVIHRECDLADGDFSFAKDERLAELNKQLEALKENHD